MYPWETSYIVWPSECLPESRSNLWPRLLEEKSPTCQKMSIFKVSQNFTLSRVIILMSSKVVHLFARFVDGLSSVSSWMAKGDKEQDLGQVVPQIWRKNILLYNKYNFGIFMYFIKPVFRSLSLIFTLLKIIFATTWKNN